MKIIKALLTGVSLLVTLSLFSQDVSSLNPLPITKEEFIKSEPAIISVIDWLENTPIGTEPEKRKELNLLLITWLTNSPTVTVEVNNKVTPMSKKNPDLLVAFMGGWTKYSLQNDYSKDPVKCNLAGIQSAIKLYKLGGKIKKDKNIDKLVDMEASGGLETWIASQL